MIENDSTKSDDQRFKIDDAESYNAVVDYFGLYTERFSSHMSGPKHYHEVRFEDLVNNPEPTLRAITTFAGLEYTDALLKYYESNAASEYAAAGNEGAKR